MAIFLKREDLDALKQSFKSQLRTVVTKDARRGYDDGSDGANDEPLSISKFIAGIASGNWRNAAVEKRLFTDMEKAYGTSSESAGGALLPEQMWGQLVPAIHEESVVRKLGVLNVPLSENVAMNIGAISSGVEFTWGVEADTMSEDTSLKTAKIVLAPKKCTCLLRISNELLRSPGPAADMILRQELAAGLGEELDRVVLQGRGGTEVTGLYSQTQINSTDLSGEVDSDDALAAALEVEQAKSAITGWVSSPAVRHRLRKLKTADGSYLLVMAGTAGAGGSAILNMPQLFGAPFYTTNSVSITGMPDTDESYLCGGAWRYMAVGQSAPRIDASGDSRFANDQTELRLVTYVGMAPLHPEAFVVVRGITVS